MKSQNVPDTDPEFLKARNFLAAVQQRQNYQKALQAQKQQQQQQPQQPQQPQQTQQHQQKPQNQQPNGVANGQLRNGVSNAQGDTSSANAASPGPAAASSNAQGQSAAVQRVVAQANGSFSPDQLNLLRTQIYAFKMLSKNLALPTKLQHQLFPSQKQAIQSASNALNTASATLNEVAESKKDVPQEPKMVKSTFDRYDSPHDLLSKHTSFADHSSRARRQRIPSLLPFGVDIEQVREERERMIYNKVQARKAELAALPVNIASWDSSRSARAEDEDKLKVKALIEYKKLSLLQKQRDLRREIQQELYNYDNLAMTANRAMHRRMKKQSLREAKITEKLEKQQRDARESKEKTRQSNQLQGHY